jgi:hypothetical protein
MDEFDSSKARHDREIAEREDHISRLQKALDESDAKKRIMELEIEVKDLKKTIQLLEIGLEYVDVEMDVRPEDVLGRLNEVAQNASDAQKPRLDMIKSSLESDAGAYEPLLKAMNENKGSISIACDLAKLLVRQKELRDHIETIAQA